MFNASFLVHTGTAQSSLLARGDTLATYDHCATECFTELQGMKRNNVVRKEKRSFRVEIWAIQLPSTVKTKELLKKKWD